MDREGLASLLVYGNPITRSEIQLLTHFCVTREEMLLFPLDGNPVLLCNASITSPTRVVPCEAPPYLMEVACLLTNYNMDA